MALRPKAMLDVNLIGQDTATKLLSPRGYQEIISVGYDLVLQLKPSAYEALKQYLPPHKTAPVDPELPGIGIYVFLRPF